MEGKETYYGRKRDLLWKEKRPTMKGKETYYGRKRDILWKEKRHTMEGKETCTMSKCGVMPTLTVWMASYSSDFAGVVLIRFFSCVCVCVCVCARARACV
jgi:hypothetical protein